MRNALFTLAYWFAAAGTLIAHSAKLHAEPVYLESGWYAQLDNVRWFVGGWDAEPPGWVPFAGMPFAVGEHLTAVAEPGLIRFDVATPGWAELGEAAYVVTTTLDPRHKVGPIAFDWHTSWDFPASRRLRLEVWAVNHDDYVSPWTRTLAWSRFPGVGPQAGSAHVEGETATGYEMRLSVAIPEPDSAAAMWCALAAALGSRRTRRTCRVVRISVDAQ